MGFSWHSGIKREVVGEIYALLPKVRGNETFSGGGDIHIS